VPAPGYVRPMRTSSLALAALLGAAPALSGGAGGLPWVRDDYPDALSRARARKVPIVVDVWAPW
jgi:hypothetical protein